MSRFDRGISHSPEPEIKFGSEPIWWHHHGHKMILLEEDKTGYDPNKVIIRGSAAEVIVSKHPNIVDYWFVDWKVVQSMEEFSKGRTSMRFWDMERAFGLSDERDEHCDAILEKFGGTTAHQGKYIRYLQYLNIPGPGTGHDGDPNVSIELDSNIQETIRRFILK